MDLKIEGEIWKNYKSWEKMFFLQRIESLNLVQFGAATVIFFQMSTLVGVSWQGKLKITMLHNV